MTLVWDKISNLAEYIESEFKKTGKKIDCNEDHYDWYNSIYTSDSYRRAHIEIVDKRDTHKIYILHTTIFAHFNDSSPIWGFDAVCGPNKITGAFHDFSFAGSSDHFMMKWFSEETKKYNWNKERVLPDWAKHIFSNSMVAAGNVQEEKELNDLCNLAKTSLEYYLKNVGITQESGADFHMAQNRYCHYQKQNPHVTNSMISMGIKKDVMEKFVQEILFPEV